MNLVGVIANPASGKDIRRLVAHGSVFDNDEKVSIVRRVLAGIDSTPVDRVLIMPDRFGIGLKATDGLNVATDVDILDMPVRFEAVDSEVATRHLVDLGAGCIVTLGGDGTNRLVAKHAGTTPILPISTGTNNAFPVMMEATTAGIAAGLVSVGITTGAVAQMPIIRCTGPGFEDVALVDAAVYTERFIGARAVWDPDRLREVVLTRLRPGSIGLSSIGSAIHGDDHPRGHGLFIDVHPDAPTTVRAPIAPGLILDVHVAGTKPLAPGDSIEATVAQPSVIAFDGEREHELPEESSVTMRFDADGPLVVDAGAAIAEAARHNWFHAD
ncbi:MAG: NAD(+)/NADH kinase [Acidimicrobiia bacterium]|nr:NAD(+)/NADH kinase [Acidimicrobiia bacterium]MDH4307386.1 NAD(+)/NADH kinase [Acidimicrobiia bacterium]